MRFRPYPRSYTPVIALLGLERGATVHDANRSFRSYTAAVPHVRLVARQKIGLAGYFDFIGGLPGSKTVVLQLP